MSPRAVAVLQQVDRIAAEDTRHSRRLLTHFAIERPLFALHAHNEHQQLERVLGFLRAGEDVAIISDAGTPLISDPGYVIVREAHRHKVKVVPIPGPSAPITALSAGGLATDRFLFNGFLPARQTARRAQLAELATQTMTLVFHEAPHRIVNSLADMVDLFGAERLAVLARELTKTFETVRLAPLGELLALVRSDPDQRRGEFVLLIEGAVPPQAKKLDAQACEVVDILAAELPLKQVVALAAQITGARRNLLYQYAITRCVGEIKP